MTHLLSEWSKQPFAFGGAALSGEGGGYGFGRLEDARGLLERSFELGVNIFDTAPIYGFGESEKVLSTFIKDKRENVRVISKSGVYWHENKRVDMTNDPKITAKMFEDSLRRLDSDYIDLYMIHWPDSKVDIRYPLEVLAKFKEQGKVLEIGLCNTYMGDLKPAEEVVPIKVVQSQFNVYDGPPEDVKEYIQEKNLSFMAWGPFDKGILTGRVSKKREQAKDYDENDCRKNAPWWNQKDVLAKVEKIHHFEEIAKKKDLTMAELAMSYTLSPSWSHVALLGAKTIKDLEAVVLGKRVTLSAEEMKDIEERCRI